MPWRPTDSQLKLLKFIQLQARVSAAEAGRVCGMKEHTVFYAMRLLRGKGLLISRPLINYSRLGYTEYILYLRVVGGATQTRARLKKWAAETECVAELIEVGGEFQYELQFITRNVLQLEEALKGLSFALDGMPVQRSLSLKTSVCFFGTKCLVPLRKKLPTLGYRNMSQDAVLSPLDLKILSTLQWADEINISHISREIGEAASTVEYRLRRLEEKGVIVGYFYDFSALNELLGYNNFDLLVRTGMMQVDFTKAFFEFCCRHNNIDILHTALGSFDYKLEVNVLSYQALLGVVDEIYENFGGNISEINIVPRLRVHQVSGFPVSYEAYESHRLKPAMVE